MHILTLNVIVTQAMINSGCHVPDCCPVAEGIRKAMCDRHIYGIRPVVTPRAVEIDCTVWGSRNRWLLCTNPQEVFQWIKGFDHCTDEPAKPAEFLLHFYQA